MATKYGLVRKSKKGNWKPIWNNDDSGESVEGGVNSDRAAVQRDLEWLRREYPGIEYALVEVEA